jgi:hypothetical protein
MGGKQTAARRATLSGWGNRSRLRLALRQANRRRRTHPEPPRRRTAQLPALDLANNSNPKIN